ncbi:hypothetical protein APS_0410 [Acetobacter pasteurianus subsp. pasteurianus LMG 1262 = NBRC 106471]|nr:hypothetical protein APS_0410 [Acetobacter pasteurianus subsp. pasteurianus LMG 1262 = NBRC 106471]
MAGTTSCASNQLHTKRLQTEKDPRVHQGAGVNRQNFHVIPFRSPSQQRAEVSSTRSRKILWMLTY